MGGFPKIAVLRILVLGFYCLLAASCDFPQGFGEGAGKGSLTITLPGANVPAQNLTARAVHLPEPITGDMSYTLDFYKSGEFFSIGPVREKVVTVELEPGYWDIVVTAYYGPDMAAFDKKPHIEIRAGQANSVSFTMNADDYVTPDIFGWVNQDKNMNTSDPPETLLVTMNTSTNFSNIPGWTDNFLYQWYYETVDGTRNNLTAPDNFSGPGTANFSCLVDNNEVGTFYYYVEITNEYIYISGGQTITGTATKSIYVANVVVTP
ncbi:MAG: hypothetical protein LBQ38_08605 [Spirochaetaceae bacterium]|jgi:hypothetical protein|nr:hypothetical protein [Spirochaetaceae bacterium]